MLFIVVTQHNMLNVLRRRAVVCVCVWIEKSFVLQHWRIEQQKPTDDILL
jgi:hypothetical protein